MYESVNTVIGNNKTKQNKIKWLRIHFMQKIQFYKIKQHLSNAKDNKKGA